MRTLLSIAAIGMAILSTEASARELSAEASEEVLADGEVIWSNDRAGFVVRHRGRVYFCGVSREFNSQTSEHYAELKCWDTIR